MNSPFLKFFWDGYLHWGLADEDSVLRHLALLGKVLPQYWSGNFPFGYLQNSSLGRAFIPFETGWYASFLAGWGFLTIGGSVAGYLWAAFQAGVRSRTELAASIPMFCFLGYFVVSAQVWDAASLRYLAFLIIGCGVGCALGLDLLCRWNRRAGLLALAVLVLVQGSILVRRFKDLPAEFPAIRVARAFEHVSLETGLANHWAAGSAQYLHGDRIRLIDYERLLSNRDFPFEILGPRNGLAVLGGLDRSEAIRWVGDRLKEEGYQFIKEWPMEHGWSILEFRRPGTSRSKVD